MLPRRQDGEVPFANHAVYAYTPTAAQMRMLCTVRRSMYKYVLAITREAARRKLIQGKSTRS